MGDRLYAKATIIAGNTNFCAVAAVGNYITVYSCAGRRMFPTLVLEDAIAILETNTTNHLMAITSNADFYIWDVTKPAVVLHNKFAPITSSPGLSILHYRLLDDGTPIVTLSNMQSFTYHVAMQVWICVADDSFPKSDFVSNIDLGRNKGLLDDIQTKVPRSLLMPGDDRASNIESLAHLENQIACAEALKSKLEYKYWLFAYVKRLTTESKTERLVEICNSLLGPANSSISAPWDPEILEMSKRDLLKELSQKVIPSAARLLPEKLRVDFIRLASSYVDQLKEISYETADIMEV